MRVVLLIALVFPWPASARLCTYLKDGVTTISSKPIPGARRLGCLGSGKSPGARRGPAKAKRTSSKKASGKGRREGADAENSARRASRYADFVAQAAKTYELPASLIWAVMRVESNFFPEAVSHKGALGLMQLMPPTAADMGVEDPFDPWQNIMGGARYLRLLANRFDGDTVKMISGYHAGGGAVNRANGIPYRETGEYLRRVLNAYYAYQKKPPTKVQ